MTVIASYSERRFDGRRVFQLLPDRILVSGKQSLGGEFDQTVMLETLQAVPNRFRSRPEGFGAGIFMVIVAVALTQGAGLQLMSYWGGLVMMLGVSGLLLSMSTLRKVEWVIFKSSGGADLLTIARAGPEKKNFEVFVQAIIGQQQSNSEKQ